MSAREKNSKLPSPGLMSADWHMMGAITDARICRWADSPVNSKTGMPWKNVPLAPGVFYPEANNQTSFRYSRPPGHEG
jgi:hypothetical protein